MKKFKSQLIIASLLSGLIAFNLPTYAQVILLGYIMLIF